MRGARSGRDDHLVVLGVSMLDSFFTPYLVEISYVLACTLY